MRTLPTDVGSVAPIGVGIGMYMDKPDIPLEVIIEIGEQESNR